MEKESHSTNTDNNNTTNQFSSQDHLSIIQYALDKKYVHGQSNHSNRKQHSMSDIVDSANNLRTNFSLTPGETAKLVHFIKDKLNNLLAINKLKYKNLQFPIEKTMKLSKQNNNSRTRTIRFVVDDSSNSILVTFGELHDSPQDIARAEQIDPIEPTTSLGDDSPMRESH